MLREKVLLFSTLALFSLIFVGCGSSVQEGVADGADEPEPELTEEEIAGEEEATSN